MKRYTYCARCGSTFYTDKPQDPERDTGFGHCESCHDAVARSWVKHGFPGERSITYDQAITRLQRYA